MKTSRILLAAILMVMIVVAVLMLLHNEKQRRTRTRPPKAAVAKVAPAAKPPRHIAKVESTRPAPPPRRAERGDSRPERPPSSGTHREPGAMPLVGASVAPAMPMAYRADKGVPSEVAREALKLVGTDPVAESIWIDAIRNPALPAADRKNLIEDLNEAGFADPKNPTAEELPLIQHRIALIERLAPTAIDEVNAAAFTEAYKDLKAMATRLAQPPQPQPQPEQPAMQPQPQPELPQPEQPQP